MASASARSAAPTVSAASPTAMSSCTRCHSAGLVPRGPERDDRRVVEDEAGQLAGGVERRDDQSRPLGRLEQVGAHALLAAGHHDDPVRRVAVDHDRLLAADDPLRRLATGPGAHGARAARRGPARPGRPCRGACRRPGRPAARWRRGPGPPAWRPRRRRRTGRAAGCGPSARARCTSRAGRRRCRRASSGTRRPVQPRSTSVDHSAGRDAGVVVGQLAQQRRVRTRARARCAPPPAARAARRRT